MKPLLVLLPGMDGTGDLFEPFIAALGGEFEVRVVRYPGDHADGYEELEAIARAAIPEGQPYVLLGESFSGPVAISIAASAPGDLRGLVLCCTFARRPRPGLSALLDVVGILASPLRKPLMGAIRQVAPTALLSRLRAALAVDVSGELAACTVPILYLRASNDRLVPRAAGELIKEIQPGTNVAEFSAPHFLLQTVPHQAARSVARFVREHA